MLTISDKLIKYLRNLHRQILPIVLRERSHGHVDRSFYPIVTYRRRYQLEECHGAFDELHHKFWKCLQRNKNKTDFSFLLEAYYLKRTFRGSEP